MSSGRIKKLYPNTIGSNMPLNDLPLPVPVSVAIKRIKGLNHYSDIDKVLLQVSKEFSDFNTLDDLTYIYNGYTFTAMLNGIGGKAGENLEIVNALQIESAPILIDHIKVGGLLGVLVTYYPDCKKDFLLPYTKYEKNIAPVSDEAKRRFLRDIEIMAENNLMHPFTLAGPSYWLVNPDTGKIFLDSWSRLTEISLEKKDEIIALAKEKLGIKSL